ncbi:MAG: hypothetical protein LBG75_02090 [Candidatus Nomurabacteria bacterium]|jgi:hypothetical protein|nr:hypothetical protein [Candidatus Nomurabacteria bacterium]
MKEVIEGFKDIIENHKAILAAMVLLLILSLIAVAILIIGIQPSNLQVWFRYANFGESFYREKWTYFIVFIVGALTVGVLNNMIAAKLYVLRGRIPAIVLLLVSIFLVLFMLFVSFSIFGINREAGIWT